MPPLSKAVKLVLAAGAGYMIGLFTGWATYTAWLWKDGEL